MSWRSFSIRTLGYFCIVASLFACRTNRNTTKLFRSEIIEDTVRNYLRSVDCIPNRLGNPTITVIELYRIDDNTNMCISSYPGWGHEILDTSSVLLCRGKLEGHIVYIRGNPRYKEWLKWKDFSLSSEDIAFLNEKNAFLKPTKELLSLGRYCVFQIKRDGTIIRLDEGLPVTL